MRSLKGYTHVITIGSGTFSNVYRAFDPELERYIALKVVPVRQRSQMSGVEREARLLAGSGLTSVPHLYAVRKHGKKVLLAMEWINGIPLSELLSVNVGANARKAIATELIHALRQLHDSNIAHGDLKPANIIVTPERGVVFVDFGFSFPLHNNGTRMAVRGTPAYMAPELWVDARHKDIDYCKADLYALGLILEQLLDDPIPPYISSLHETDPEQRPADCKTLERYWRRSHVCTRDENTRHEIIDATAIYIAGVLLDGARSLYTSGNPEESYALLTESLEKWPDNAEALAFLQKRFSGPTRNNVRKKLRRFSIAAVLIIGALFSAYVFGRYASGEKLTDTVQEVFAFSEQRRLQLQLPPTRAAEAHELTGMMRTIDNTNGLDGKLVLALPEGRGTLSINGKRQAVNGDEEFFSGLFSAGMYRIEWYDSTAGRRYGETTDLLPFATKTVSLKRFEGGYRNGK